jgi:hypothetical protein
MGISLKKSQLVLNFSLLKTTKGNGMTGRTATHKSFSLCLGEPWLGIWRERVDMQRTSITNAEMHKSPSEYTVK